MKNLKTLLLGAICALALLPTTAVAQQIEAKITKSQIINASADDVWSILRVMDDIDKYSSVIAKVDWTGPKGEGGSRVCTSADGQGKFKESILTFSDEERSYTYAVVEGVPAAGMVNNFKVVDLGYNKSMIVWTSNFDKFMKNPQMTEVQFIGFLNQTIDEMIMKVTAKSKV